MSTRQYIGARYVPKFADPIQWDNTRSYEALTMVTNLGNCYTSKKSVPTGVAISNTEYWALTGNYNAQVEEYREEVEQLQEDFEALSDKVYPNYKNIILIGDSYGTANGGTVTISHPFPERVQAWLGLGNDNFRASFANGAGFGNGAFYTNFNAIASSMTDDEMADVSDIYFIGGWNDESNRVTQAQFLAGVEDCEALISSKFTHAQKHIVLVAHSVASSTYERLSTTIEWYDDLEKRGWAVDRNMRYVLINPAWVIADGAHPNQDGVDALAKYFCDVVYSGQCDVDYLFQLVNSDFTMAEGFKSNFYNIGGRLRFYVNDGNTAISLYSNNNAWVIQFVDENNDPTTKAITCNGTTVEMISLSNKIYGYQNNVEMPIQATIYDSSHAAYNIDGTLLIKENKIYYKPGFRYNAAHSGAVTITAECIVITGGAGNVPSFCM